MTDDPKNNREWLTEAMSGLKLTNEQRYALIHEHEEVIDMMRACKDQRAFLSAVLSIEPDMTQQEFSSRYQHVMDYYKARFMVREETKRQERSLARMVREDIDRVFGFMESDEELKNRPMAFMAFRVRNLRNGYIDIESVETHAKSSLADKKKWAEKQKKKGFQLIFYSLGGEWKLLDNTTGADDKVVSGALSQEQLEDIWLKNHPVKSHREALREERGPENIH